MPQPIECPTCTAPVDPDPRLPTIKCPYCGYQMKNTVYAPPPAIRRAPAPPAPKSSRHVWIIGLIAGGISVIAVLPAIIFSVRRASPPSAAFAETPRAAMPEPAPEAKPDPPPDPQRLLESKLKLYLACLGNTYPRFDSSRKRYFRWLRDRERGPSCRERYVTYGMYSLNGVDFCRKPIAEEAKKLQPPVPALQRAAEAYAAALIEAEPLIAEGASYYGKKGYALDDCKKGQALHPKLLASYARIDEARVALRAQLAAKVEGTLERCLARTKGADLEGARRWALIVKEAGDLLKVMRKHHGGPDLAQVKAAIARFTEVVSAFEKLPEQQRKDAGFDWSRKRPVDDLQRAAMTYLQRKGGRRFSSSERWQLRHGWDRAGMSGTFENMIKRYNELASTTHYMKECGPLMQCLPDECPAPR